MEKPQSKIKEIANKKVIKKIVRKSKNQIFPFIKKNMKVCFDLLVRFWSKCMKSFAKFNLRNKAITAFSLFALSFFIGFLFGNNNNISSDNYVKPTQSNSVNSQQIQKGKCDLALWRQANIVCKGDARCAGKTYREASAGDISGGLDCITKSMGNKMNFGK